MGISSRSSSGMFVAALNVILIVSPSVVGPLDAQCSS